MHLWPNLSSAIKARQKAREKIIVFVFCPALTPRTQTQSKDTCFKGVRHTPCLSSSQRSFEVRLGFGWDLLAHDDSVSVVVEHRSEPQSPQSVNTLATTPHWLLHPNSSWINYSGDWLWTLFNMWDALQLFRWHVSSRYHSLLSASLPGAGLFSFCLP